MAERIKMADRFNTQTMVLVARALEGLAQEHERKAAFLPQEYRSGVSMTEVDQRKRELNLAAECREAIGIVRALANRASTRVEIAKEPK